MTTETLLSRPNEMYAAINVLPSKQWQSFVTQGP